MAHSIQWGAVKVRMDIISVLELKIIQWCLICKILVRILRFSQILCCVKRKRKFSVNQSSQIVVSLFSHGRLHGELDKSVNFGNIDHHSPLCGLCGHSKWAHCEDTQETKSPLFVQSSNLLPALRVVCNLLPVKQFPWWFQLVLTAFRGFNFLQFHIGNWHYLPLEI